MRNLLSALDKLDAEMEEFCAAMRIEEEKELRAFKRSLKVREAAGFVVTVFWLASLAALIYLICAK